MDCGFEGSKNPVGEGASEMRFERRPDAGFAINVEALPERPLL